jgi:hypothetical protein
MFFVSSLSCSAQIKTIVQKIEKNAQLGLATDSILRKIQKENDLVIGYSSYNTTWRHVPIQYFLIGLKNNQSKAYSYTINQNVTNKEVPFTLDSMIVSNTNKDSILALFKQANGWSLKHVEDGNTIHCSDIPNSAHCTINDASAKSLIVMTKTHQQISNFYAPEFFEQCCPGNAERQRFLTIIRPIKNFFLITITK